MALDPYGVGAIVDTLDEVGISGQERIVGISSQCSGLMSWPVANARVEPKGNAITITKQAAGTAKIDPFLAAFNAIAVMSTNPGSSPRPGLFFI